MSDLLTQLRDYGRELDAMARPLPDRVPTVAPEVRERRPRWVPAFVAALATMILVGTVALLLRGDAADPPVGAEVPETWTTWTAEDGVVSSCACSMTIAADGSVWIAGFDGVSRFDGERWERMTLPRPMTGEGWPEVAAAPDGSVWMSGMSFVTRYRGGEWDLVVDAGVQDDGGPLAFETLLVDGSGRVWTILADEPGLVVDGGGFVAADESTTGIPGYQPGWGIPSTVGAHGELWFYTVGPDGSDIRVDGDVTTSVVLPAGIIGFDTDGSLWMGDMYPVTHDNRDSLVSYGLGGVRGTAFTDRHAWFLVNRVTDDARLLFGAEQWSPPGLYRFDGDDWQIITADDWLPGERFSVLRLAEDGALWIATADGTVTRYQPGSDPRSGTPVEIDSGPYTEPSATASDPTPTTAPTTTTAPTPTTAPTTTESEVQSTPELAGETIDAYYSALNEGAIDEAVALLSPDTDGRHIRMLKMAVKGLSAVFHYDCAVEYGTYVLCTETVTDALYGPAGITLTGSVGYRFDGRHLTVDGTSILCLEPTGTKARYLIDLRVWARTAHWELDDHWIWGSPIDSVLAIPCTYYPFGSVEQAAEIADIVHEFIAQSDEWPKQP